jgi:thioredoxin reductase/NAD-dependent dihydropyrimidine dehydrogenase PreA subunit
MADTHLFYLFYLLVLAFPLTVYWVRQQRREARARDALAKGELFGEASRGQHPHIDVTNCIGCQGCTSACPEGDVLGMAGGKAAVIKGYKCIGHGLCVEACPVGAIKLITANPKLSADLPVLTSEYETTVPGLFIAGELGGLALIKNAVNQGKQCVDVIARRLESEPQPRAVTDVLIVGAGPAGITAALRCIERKLSYLLIEREGLGGTIAKYPRQKLVMTSPVEFPLFGPMRKLQLSKENLIQVLEAMTHRPDFHVRSREAVERIHRRDDGLFAVNTTSGAYEARHVILAMGRSGTPRKLDVPGEELPKVMYRLIEADHYTSKKILVVGGGDSAVEAAVGLSMQPGNNVTLSYRKDKFLRIKERNTVKLQEALRTGHLNVIFNSNTVEIRERSVLLEVNGETREIPNDFVWVFAGGVAPNDFLKSIGVGFGSRDLTLEATQAAALSSPVFATEPAIR